MELCKANAKETLESFLGRGVSEMETQEFVQQGALHAARKAMETAMKSSATTDEKQAAARDAARAAIASSLGQKNISDAELQAYINKGAENAVLEQMQSCVAAIDKSVPISQLQVRQESCRTVSDKPGLG